MTITCWFCKATVNPAQSGVYRRVVGWEQTRRGGGANKIALRDETGDWAHRDCVDRERHTFQGVGLFDMAPHA